LSSCDKELTKQNEGQNLPEWQQKSVFKVFTFA